MMPKTIKKTAHLKALDMLAQMYPNATTALDAKENPFTFLIAVVLSARCTDVAVNKVMPHLFKEGPYPRTLINLGEEGIAKRIKTIGLYRTKSKHLYKIAKILENDLIPSGAKELTALPGVGVKTAAVVQDVIFDQISFPVDTHVFRVSKRIGIAHAATREKVSKELEQVTPSSHRKKICNRLVEHGRKICKAKKPVCQICPIGPYCDFYLNTKTKK